MTEKLYYSDINKLEFVARIIKTTEDKKKGGWQVVLDCTCFYPEGGGQPADRGWINGIPVLDVQKKSSISKKMSSSDGDEDEVIYHLLSEYPGGEDTEVTGKIDKDRRIDYMQQHTGQHILSGALWQVGQYKTLSVHMGEDVTTIEIDVPEISTDNVIAVEDLANQVICDDIPIHFLQVDQSELGEYALRKPTNRQGKIRLVQVGNFDCVACGGLHFDRTRHVGWVKAVGIEKIRGHVRLSWKIGRRAQADYRAKDQIIAGLRPVLATNESNFVQKAQELQEELVQVKRKRNWLENRLAQTMAEQMMKQADQEQAKSNRSPGQGENYRIIAVALQEEDDVLVKKIMKEIISTGKNLACLVDILPGRVLWSIGCSADMEKIFDFNRIRQELLPLIDGNGGGRFPLWQGVGSQAGKVPEFLLAFKQILLS